MSALIIKHKITGDLLDIAWPRKDGTYNLSGANLSRADLSRANLRGADLRGANLSEADLSGANLPGADLSWADLSGANLRWADLSEADLSEADLSGADLLEADLSGADLSEADLRGADLNEANLRWADLHILGQCQRGYVFLLRDAASPDPRITAGCRDFTLSEARAHWSEAHSDDPVLRAHCLAMVATAEAIVAAIQAAK